MEKTKTRARLPEGGLKDTLAQNVRALMYQRGFVRAGQLHQSGLARLINKKRGKVTLTQSTISRVLAADDKVTKLTTLDALAAGLDVPAWVLLVPQLNAAERPLFTSIEALHRAHQTVEAEQGGLSGKEHMAPIPRGPIDRVGEKRSSGTRSGKKKGKR